MVSKIGDNPKAKASIDAALSGYRLADPVSNVLKTQREVRIQRNETGAFVGREPGSAPVPSAPTR
jgi:hypothetical protein